MKRDALIIARRAVVLNRTLPTVAVKVGGVCSEGRLDPEARPEREGGKERSFHRQAEVSS